MSMIGIMPDGVNMAGSTGFGSLPRATRFTAVVDASRGIAA